MRVARPKPQPRPKPRFRLTPDIVPEAAILASVLRALSYAPAVAWVRRVNTGAYAIGVGEGRRYVRYGWPGCSDILGQLKDGRFLAIECKTAIGKLEPEQAAFLDLVRRNGGVAGVARSIEDAMALVRGRPQPERTDR